MFLGVLDGVMQEDKLFLECAAKKYLCKVLAKCLSIYCVNKLLHTTIVSSIQEWQPLETT